MADKTHIEWTDSTWNVITGCTLVSDGCKHCYAATLAATRLKHHPSREGLARLNAADEAKFTGEVRFNEQWLEQPLRWRKPRMIFVCAHGDLFHEDVPDEWIDKVFAVMALAPRHTFQVLTKRPKRASAYMSRRDARGRFPALDYAALMAATGRWSTPAIEDLSGRTSLPNVWLGTSVENQPTADARIPHLLVTPAAVRFVSAEPLLGPVDLYGGDPDPRLGGVAAGPNVHLGQWWRHDDPANAPPRPGIDWVIAGGESGPGARPMHPDWARSLRDQCAAAGVAFHFKQWGECVPVASLGRTGPRLNIADHVTFDDGTVVRRVGKSRAGRLLDGVQHNGMPEVRR